MEEGDTGRRRAMGEDQPAMRREKRGGARGGKPKYMDKTEGSREPGKKTREIQQRRSSLRLEDTIEKG